MLRRVARPLVRLGMYIERIEGDWLDNPFWRTGFVITRPADLAKLHESSVEFVVIDDSKGIAGTMQRLQGERNGAEVKLSASMNARPSAERIRIVQTAQACRRAIRDVFLSVQGGRGFDAGRSRAVVDMIAQSLEKHPAALISLTRMKTIEGYTFAHSVSVAALLVCFGRHLNLHETEIRQVGMAGLLHDVGKMRIEPALLRKTGALTDAEMGVIRTHPALGHEILAQSDELPALALDVCRHHHERIDGSGYPDGLSGEEISFHVRIAAICDTFDALTTVRPYKLAWSTERALSSMASWTGHFDPELLREFTLSIGRDERLLSEEALRDVVTSSGTAINGYSDPGI